MSSVSNRHSYAVRSTKGACNRYNHLLVRNPYILMDQRISKMVVLLCSEVYALLKSFCRLLGENVQEVHIRFDRGGLSSGLSVAKMSLVLSGDA